MHELVKHLKGFVFFREQTFDKKPGNGEVAKSQAVKMVQVLGQSWFKKPRKVVEERKGGLKYDGEPVFIGIGQKSLLTKLSSVPTNIFSAIFSAMYS